MNTTLHTLLKERQAQLQKELEAINTLLENDAQPETESPAKRVTAKPAAIAARKHKKWAGKAERENLINAIRTSIEHGLSTAEACKKHGVVLNTYYGWLHKKGESVKPSRHEKNGVDLSVNPITGY